MVIRPMLIPKLKLVRSMSMSLLDRIFVVVFFTVDPAQSIHVIFVLVDSISGSWQSTNVVSEGLSNVVKDQVNVLVINTTKK